MNTIFNVCISMSNDEILIYVLFSWVFHNVKFSEYWRAENAISAHSETGLIKSMILNILVFWLEISVTTIFFSQKSQIAGVVINVYHI